MRNILYKVNSYITDQCAHQSLQMLTFGIVMSINFPLYLVIWWIQSPQSSHDAILRIIATICSLLIVMKSYWPKALQPFIAVYWYLLIIFTLPFFFVYMTLVNHASTLWLMNLMSAIFFTLLLLDIYSSLVVLILGSAIAIFAFYATHTGFTYAPGVVDLQGIIPTIFAALVIGALFSRNREAIENAKLRSMKMLSSSIAHEVKTPIGAIQLNANGIKQASKEISDVRIRNFIEKSQKNIQQETKKAVTFIDFVLNNLKDLTLMPLETCSIEECIKEAIDRYPYQGQREREKIILKEIIDFDFIGHKELMVHVIFNLIKNALYFITRVQKGNIYIWTEKDSETNYLYFRDTGTGMSKSKLKHIFHEFYSDTGVGSGVGLYFCKRVMKLFNGDISCTSELSEYTQFKLSFPVIYTK